MGWQRKSGALEPEKDAEGNEINPHIPQYMSEAPWYLNTGVGLKHTKDYRDKSIKDGSAARSIATIGKSKKVRTQENLALPQWSTSRTQRATRRTAHLQPVAKYRLPGLSFLSQPEARKTRGPQAPQHVSCSALVTFRVLEPAPLILSGQVSPARRREGGEAFEQHTGVAGENFERHMSDRRRGQPLHTADHNGIS